MHRGECGVDQSFVWACEKLGINTEMPPLDWQGGLTSPKRHDELIFGSDLCVLLHLDFATSEDTKDVARRAIAAGIRTFLVDNDRAMPRRLQASDGRLA